MSRHAVTLTNQHEYTCDCNNQSCVWNGSHLHLYINAPKLWLRDKWNCLYVSLALQHPGGSCARFLHTKRYYSLGVCLVNYGFVFQFRDFWERFLGWSIVHISLQALLTYIVRAASCDPEPRLDFLIGKPSVLRPSGKHQAYVWTQI